MRVEAVWSGYTRARMDQGLVQALLGDPDLEHTEIGAHRGQKALNLDAGAVKGGWPWPWPCQHLLPLRLCWFLSLSSQVQIQSKKVDISKVSSKCGSKANIKHKPGERLSLPWCLARGLSPAVCPCTAALSFREREPGGSQQLFLPLPPGAPCGPPPGPRAGGQLCGRRLRVEAPGRVASTRGQCVTES